MYNQWSGMRGGEIVLAIADKHSSLNFALL
jgi:hypothetical protein